MDEDLTPEEADALFEQTQPICDAIRAVAEAELIVEAAATTIPVDVRNRIDAALRRASTDDKDIS